MFLPQVMRPIPTAIQPTNPGILRIAESPFSVLRGPPGSYVAERLAAAVETWDRWAGCVWLRTQRSQPAALAGSLAGACWFRWTDGDQRAGSEAAPEVRLDETMQRSPPGAVVVVELGGRFTWGLGRLMAALRPVAADRGVSLVAVTESRLPRAFPGSDCVVSTADLWDPGTAVERSPLPEGSRTRLVQLAGRRPAVLQDVLDAALTWPAEAVVEALDVSRRCRPALDRLTENLLALCSPAQRAALEVCAAIGYWHPQLGTNAVRATELRPWVVPLERDWGWLRPIWAPSLQRCLTGRRRTQIAPWLSPPSVAAPALASSAVGASGVGPPVVPTGAQRGLVEARLLGRFELRVDGSIVAWSGQRGVSVLRYLLARRHHTCPRDQLIEEFWPDTATRAARNRLQVAVSGLRQGLREVTNLPVIEYSNGSYRLNPQLRVSVDVERFESALATGRAAEQSGRPGDALSAYSEAVELYRGDFASDAPFEQWTLLPRESIRLTYVDTLDRMSRILLGMGRLDDCIATGHRMLDVDQCREDAHRLLMRCYANQGRPYQALRQYELCCRVLRATLSTGPAPETVRLYRSIRAGTRPPRALSG